MRGDQEIVELLNEQLTAELTAINQYFLHGKMQEDWGYPKLAQVTRSEAFGEMRHAETLTERILFLEGLPNYQRLGTLNIGQTVPEQFRSDLQLEHEVLPRLQRGITLMRERGDVTSANIFEEILKNEEEHIDYLETQLELVETLGESLYLAQLVQQPSGG